MNEEFAAPADAVTRGGSRRGPSRATPIRRLLAPLPLLLALVLGACGSGTRTDTPALPSAESGSEDGSVLRDEWYRVLVQGSTAGHSRRTVSRTPEGHFRIRTEQRIRLLRGRVPLELEVEQESEESEDGHWLGFTQVQSVSAKRIVSEGEVRGGVMHVKITGEGAPRSLDIPLGEENRGHHWLQEQAKRRLKKAGDVLIARTFLPELQQTAKVRLTLREKEEVQVGSQRRVLHARTTKIALLPDPILEWVDDEGEVWKGQYRLGNLTMEEVRSTREEVRELRIEAPPEIFLSTAVVPSRPLPQAPSVVFRISLLEGDFASRNLEDAFQLSGQTLLPGGSATTRVVRIERVEPEARVAYPPVVGPELERYLRPSSFIQSDDPAIRTRAREILAGVKEVHEAARRLESWVHDHIRTKDLHTAFASAKETFESARGDCTEHGVLLAALARAAGIPARIVTGLVYHDGKFVGHLWTEVFVDRWIPLDATRPGRVGPTHIALTTTDLSDAEGLGAFLELASFVGNLRIEILR